MISRVVPCSVVRHLRVLGVEVITVALYTSSKDHSKLPYSLPLNTRPNEMLEANNVSSLTGEQESTSLH